MSGVTLSSSTCIYLDSTAAYIWYVCTYIRMFETLMDAVSQVRNVQELFQKWLYVFVGVHDAVL